MSPASPKDSERFSGSWLPWLMAPDTHSRPGGAPQTQLPSAHQCRSTSDSVSTRPASRKEGIHCPIESAAARLVGQTLPKAQSERTDLTLGLGLPMLGVSSAIAPRHRCFECYPSHYLQFAPHSHSYPTVLVDPCRTTILSSLTSTLVLMLATTVKRATQIERGRADRIGACG